ncbi:Bacterial ribosome SSU maturation protein RimP [hydrothermal vent metagenome]|uniref:Bacterial ribosome SSU maturation protein RimP n=1 Tax=hydrothermal vent metagenome TaxID=652676 RepID=A0A3B1A7R7_9ZZZZ
MARIQQQLVEMFAPTVSALGYELLGIEYISQGKHSIVRIFIDSDKGINLDDCQQVSGQLSGILDVEDPITGEYSLEVSSPGTERPLFTIEHYKQFIGKPVFVRFYGMVEKRRKLKGHIVAVEDSNITISELETELEFVIDIDDIDKAHLIPVSSA